MESEESSGDDDRDGVGDCAGQQISENKTEIRDKETHTAIRRLEDVDLKLAEAQQRLSPIHTWFHIPTPGGDYSKLQDAARRGTYQGGKER